MILFPQVTKLLVSMGFSKSKILYAYAKSQIGAKKSGIKTSIEFGCAEAVNRVFRECFDEEIDGGISTRALYTFLLKDSRFKSVATGEIGDIIISPTTYGNGKIPNGHVGIVSDLGKIMSNNSANGIWDEHLTDILWRQRYAETGGYPIFYFRPTI